MNKWLPPAMKVKNEALELLSSVVQLTTMTYSLLLPSCHILYTLPSSFSYLSFSPLSPSLSLYPLPIQPLLPVPPSLPGGSGYKGSHVTLLRVGVSPSSATEIIAM